MKTIHIVTITAGLSEPSATALLGDQLSEATVKVLKGSGLTPEITVIRLREIATAITNYFLTGFPTGKLAEALEAVRSADAIIAVTPTFKASYNGLFKSFWDVVEDDAIINKPVLVAATGGTARHSLMIDTAMRPLFGYLRAQVVPTGVFAATDDFGADVSLQRRIDRATEELSQILAWKHGGSSVTSSSDMEEENTKTTSDSVEEKFDDRDGANSGDFFGVATHSAPKPTKTTGLPPLKVTPFADLLKGK